MDWDNFLKRSIVDDRWRSSSFAQAYGVLCATSFATVIVALSPSIQADNSVLYATNSDGTIVGFDSVGNRTLVASSALDNRLSQDLEGLAFDSLGNLYVANAGKNNIFKIDPSGAGSVLASVTNPKGVAIDGSNNLFVATSTGAIQEIDPAGNVSPFFTDSNRSFVGVALDGANNLYVADPLNVGVLELDSGANFVD